MSVKKDGESRPHAIVRLKRLLKREKYSINA
jgi:hypothetical protein